MKTFFLSLLTVLLMDPALAVEKLKNGAPFFGEKDPSLPRNILVFSFHGGPGALSAEHQGIIPILQEAFKEGPSDRTLQEYQQELFKLGAEIDYSANANVFYVIVKTPPAEQEKVLALLKKTLDNPRVSQEDYQRFHGKVLAGLKAQFENMRQVLLYFSFRDLMGYSIQTLTGDTSPVSFEKLKYETFKSSIPMVLDYQRLFISYVGSDSVVNAKKDFELVFADKMKKPYQKWNVESPRIPQVEKLKYTVIEKPGATDNQILFLYPQLVRRDSPEWAQASVTMDLLGGGLHGRLGKTLRSERGLTYGAFSRFNSNLLPAWYVWTFGGIEQTKPLLTGVPEVIQDFKKAKIQKGEVDESKARLMNDYKMGTELPKDRLLSKSWYYANGLPTELLEKYEKDLQKVDLNKVMQFHKQLQNEKAAVYLMGDKAKILPILESLGAKPETVRFVQMNEIQ